MNFHQALVAQDLPWDLDSAGQNHWEFWYEEFDAVRLLRSRAIEACIDCIGRTLVDIIMDIIKLWSGI